MSHIHTTWGHLLAVPSGIWNRNSKKYVMSTLKTLVFGTGIAKNTWWELWKQMAEVDHMSEIFIKNWTKWRKILLHETPFRSGPSKNWTCQRKELISEEEMSERQCTNFQFLPARPWLPIPSTPGESWVSQNIFAAAWHPNNTLFFASSRCSRGPRRQWCRNSGECCQRTK